MRMHAAAIGLALAVLTTALHAAEIRVIAATPMTAVVRELAAEFETGGGDKVHATFVSGPVVRQHIDRGDAFDVAISITPVIDALVKDGIADANTRTDVAYAPLAVGVRAGASKPDVSSVEGFKRALLAAASVAHSQTGASGEHLKRIMERLGIAEQMKAKLRAMPADRIAQAVPDGEAEMIVVTLSVIIGSGTQVAGLVPAELQFYNTFAAAVGTKAAQPDRARAFVRLLTGPAAIPVLKANGMEAGVPR